MGSVVVVSDDESLVEVVGTQVPSEKLQELLSLYVGALAVGNSSRATPSSTVFMNVRKMGLGSAAVVPRPPW